MIENEDQLRTMVDQTERRERRARRNALILTVVPILVAIGLLAATGWQVQKASQDLSASKVTLAFTRKTQGAAEVTLSNVESELGVANQENNAAQVKLTENSRVIADTQKQATQVQKTLTNALIQVADQQKEIDAKQTEIVSLKKQADELDKLLKLATHFQEYKFKGDLYAVLKHTYNLYDAGKVTKSLVDLHTRVMDNLEVPWNLYGTSLKEGVNSPTYVALMLGLLPQPASSSIDQETLMKYLPLQNGKPQVGDVVYYPEGLTFFYFEDDERQSVVIGMTPFGVVDLRYDFDQPIGIGKPKY